MIRLIQRRLIVPRGDTGTFSIPVLAGKETGDASVFTIFNPLTHRKIFEKVMQLSDGVLTMDLSHGDTVNLPVGQFVWDIKFYTNPTIADGHLVDGEEVDSYYAAFTLPVCEIRETGDNLLMSDEAPQATLSPGQIDYITASINEVTDLKNAAASSAAEADTSAQNAETSASAAAVSEQAAQDSQEAALASQQAAQTAAEQANASAEAAAETAAQIEADLESKANIADLDDVAFSGDYNDLSNTPYIPNKTSDLTNDSNYAVDANYVHTDNNYTTVEKNKLSGIAAGAEVNVNADWNAVNGDAFILNKPTNVSEFTNDVGYLTEHQDISGKANSADLATVATSGSYNDLSNKPFIPSAVSDLTDDSGHYTKPVTGIPASDLEETYLTSFTEIDPTVPSWAKQAQKPSYTAQEVGALPNTTYIPTKVSDLTNDSGYLTTHQDISGKADKSEIPTSVSELTNDAGYITGYTETDPTVPAWAKASTKPIYTAAEVGAPTVQEMNSAISTAIGNVNSFDMAVVQELPTQNISTHTIYLVPKTGETNDVYDEYIYINNAWEMIGNTQIDLSNYVQKTDYATTTNYGVVRISNNSYNVLDTTIGLSVNSAPASAIKSGSNSKNVITVSNQHRSVFYGLAKAAGDTTQSQSENAVGTYTNEAKISIQNMLDVPNKAGVEQKAPVIYTTGTSPIINAIPNSKFKSLILTIAGDPTNVGSTSANVVIGPSTTAAEGTTYTKSFDPIYEGTLDFVSGKLTITKAILDLGSIGYNYNDTYHYFYSQALYGIIDTNDPIYSSDMTVHTVEEIQSGEEGVAFGGATYIYVYDGEYVGMTIDEFKAAVAGKYIAYTLRTPRVVELGATAIRTLEGTTYVMSDDGAISVEYQVDTKSYIDTNIPNVPVQDVQINGSSILSSGVANVPYAAAGTPGLVQPSDGLAISSSGSGRIMIVAANNSQIKGGIKANTAIDPLHQHESVFYGLAKAAGDSTQSVSTNAVGTYTDSAKTSIQAMLNVPSKTNTVLDTTLSMGRKEDSIVGAHSVALGAEDVIASGECAISLGESTEATGDYSLAEGGWTQATGDGAHAEGDSTIASGYASHAEGCETQASNLFSHAEGCMTEAQGEKSHAEGYGTIATGDASHVGGMYNVIDDYSNWPEWVSETSYIKGDKVKRTITENNKTIVKGYICYVANNDTTFNKSHWFDDGQINYVEIIGNGDDKNKRSNARALDWNGNEYLAGDLYVHANNDSTGGTRLATITEVAAKLDAAEAGLKVVRLI